jgi:hypothetical protein
MVFGLFVVGPGGRFSHDELVTLTVIALFVVGPLGLLPTVLRMLGRTIGKLRR